MTSVVNGPELVLHLVQVPRLDHHRGLDGPAVVAEHHAQGPQDREVPGEVLREWQLTDPIDDMELCASELATNALLHGVPRDGNSPSGST